MPNRYVFVASGGGLLLALVSALIFGEQPTAQPPAFKPAANPYANGIYADGIIESAQAQGENVNIYPEVAGPITQVLVAEGARVHRGDVLLTIDDSVQRASTEQQLAQAEAAHAMLVELKAEPRPETLDIAAAQVSNAQASLKNADDQLAKQEQSYGMDPKSVSRDVLDNARNARNISATNLAVVQRQYALTKAGAWRYDIQSQDRQYAALMKSYAASCALLAKYTIRAPSDGVVRTLAGAVGSYVSPQGTYDTYTGAMSPLVVMGSPEDRLQVRVYVDEILIHRLDDPGKIRAQMFIRGTERSFPLTFARIQPFVSPKIELSNARQERVDLRVLPLIFQFDRPRDLPLYPGQLVDVYVSAK